MRPALARGAVPPPPCWPLLAPLWPAPAAGVTPALTPVTGGQTLHTLQHTVCTLSAHILQVNCTQSVHICTVCIANSGDGSSDCNTLSAYYLHSLQTICTSVCILSAHTLHIICTGDSGPDSGDGWSDIAHTAHYLHSLHAICT